MRTCWCWLFVTLYAFSALPLSTVNADDNPIAHAVAFKTTQQSQVREFEIRVDNKPVGTHSLTIKSDGEHSEVSIQSDVKMDFIVYAYVFKFRGSELWRDGRVECADIRCEDGGKKRSFSLKTDGKVQQVAFNGKPVSPASTAIMTTAYWQLPHADFRAKPLTILDVDRGTTHTASLNLIGSAKVTCNGQTMTCRHFKIDGPSPAELWFDDEDRLVRQKSVEQGHAMELSLKQIKVLK